MSNALAITDPRHAPPERPNAWQRFALTLIRDERDLPFVTLSASMFVVCAGCAIALYIPGVFRWYLGVAYLAMLFGCFFDRYILMLHNTSHRPLYRKDKAWMNYIVPWVLAPFAGQSPNTYFAHHIGMHHPENNLPDDLSTTMRFQRDSFIDFMRYFLRFFFCCWLELALYHRARGRMRLMRNVLVGEALFIGTVGALLWVSFWPTMIVFGIPFLLARFLMMAGNWGQHAFIDASDPANPYLNSIDCINTRYNRRCFNDGYHIGHHEKATRHWTDMPGNFEAKRQLYIDHDAIVFEGVDFFMVWFYLMLKRYDWLARRAVHIGPEPESEAAYVAFLRGRTRPILSDV